MDCSETIEVHVYDIKFGIYSKLIEYMEIYMYQRSGCSLTFVHGHTDFINFKQLLP